MGESPQTMLSLGDPLFVSRRYEVDNKKRKMKFGAWAVGLDDSHSAQNADEERHSGGLDVGAGRDRQRRARRRARRVRHRGRSDSAWQRRRGRVLGAGGDDRCGVLCCDGRRVNGGDRDSRINLLRHSVGDDTRHRVGRRVGHRDGVGLGDAGGAALHDGGLDGQLAPARTTTYDYTHVSGLGVRFRGVHIGRLICRGSRSHVNVDGRRDSSDDGRGRGPSEGDSAATDGFLQYPSVLELVQKTLQTYCLGHRA